MRRLHALPILIEPFEIFVFEHWRSREQFQGADNARKFAVQRRRVDARRFDQPALADRPVVGERAPHEDARQQSARQEGAENQEEQVEAERAQPG